MSRSSFLRGGGALLVAASGLGALAPAAALADGTPDGDLAYLRLLIAAELLGVDFYSQALEQGALQKPYSTLARRLRAEEHEHYAMLAALLTAAGGTPATAGDIDFTYPAETFASRRSIVAFAKELERVLTGTYVDALEHVQTPGLRTPLARILANEAQHHAALAVLQGEPAIQKPFPTPFRMDAMSDFLGNYES